MPGKARKPAVLFDSIFILGYFAGVVFFLFVASRLESAEDMPAWVVVAVALLTATPAIWLNLRMVRVNEELADAESIMAQANLEMATATQRLTQIELDREAREATRLDLVIFPTPFTEFDNDDLAADYRTWLSLEFEIFNRSRRGVTLRDVFLRLRLEEKPDEAELVIPHVLYAGAYDPKRDSSELAENLVIPASGRARFAGRFWFHQRMKLAGEMTVTTVTGESIGGELNFALVHFDDEHYSQGNP